MFDELEREPDPSTLPDDDECEARFLEQILNALPLATFVMDEEACIRSFNSKAASSFGVDAQDTRRMAIGDLVACANADHGCGNSPDCAGCEVRGAVRRALDGEPVHRVKAKKHWRLGSSRGELHLLVTAAPLQFGDRSFALLTVEDITDTVALRGLLPICSYCKKIRDDEDYWVAVEQFIQRHSDAVFSHSICNDCLDEHHPGMREKINTPRSPR